MMAIVPPAAAELAADTGVAVTENAAVALTAVTATLAGTARPETPDPPVTPVPVAEADTG
jgi:hypothetical protein